MAELRLDPHHFCNKHKVLMADEDKKAPYLGLESDVSDDEFVFVTSENSKNDTKNAATPEEGDASEMRMIEIMGFQYPYLPPVVSKETPLLYSAVCSSQAHRQENKSPAKENCNAGTPEGDDTSDLAMSANINEDETKQISDLNDCSKPKPVDAEKEGGANTSYRCSLDVDNPKQDVLVYDYDALSEISSDLYICLCWFCWCSDNEDKLLDSDIPRRKWTKRHGDRKKGAKYRYHHGM